MGEYLVDMDATKAARRCGYSVKTAAQQGYRLLRNAHIETALAKKQAQLFERIELTAETVLEEIRRSSGLTTKDRHFLRSLRIQT